MIKTTVVLALGLLAAAALRRQSAAFRHLILAATIACAAVMPLIEAVVPVWQLPLLTARAGGLAPALTLGDAPGGQATSTADVAAPAFRPPAILPMLRSIWAIGVGLSVLLLAIGLGRLMSVAARARPVQDGRWAAGAKELAERYGLSRAPSVLQTGHPTLLFTWGFRRPIVVVPCDAATWCDERIRIVLGHELAHIRRGDWAVQLLADCVRCGYWFNPLVWVACRRLRLESEHACDDAVLGLGVAAPDYASQLLELARLFRHGRRSFFPAPAMARPSDLERRVRVMLHARTDHSPMSRVSGLLVSLALLALTVPIAGLSLGVAPPTRGGEPLVASAPYGPVPPPAGAARQGSAAPQIPDVVRPPAPAVAANAVPPTSSPAPGASAPPAVEPARAFESLSQPGTNAAYGVTVVDQLGKTVPNASVRLSNTVSGQIVEGVTDQSGEWGVSDLPADEYQLTVQKPGFKTVRLTVRFAESQMARSRVVLQLGSLAEMIVVSGVAGATPPATFAPQVRHAGVPAVNDPCLDSVEGGCVTPPRKLADAKPIYPAIQLSNGLSGVVIINARLRADGSVGDLQPAEGADPDFADAAMHAIRLWEFTPARLNGVPMEVQLQVTVQFVVVKK
jgi:TonB family protein